MNCIYCAMPAVAIIDDNAKRVWYNVTPPMVGVCQRHYKGYMELNK